MRLPWWLGGRGEESRSIDSVPWNVGDGGPLNLDRVSPEAALRLAPVYAAGDRLAGAISSLPLQVYRQTGRRREKLTTLPQLFRQPAVVGTRVDWVYRMVISAALRGNAVGMISAVDSDGYAERVEWLRPDLVSVRDDAPSGPGSAWQPLWFYRGREVPAESIVHVPWFCQPGRVWGLSPIGAYAATAGIALAAHDYKSDWFRAGGVPPGRFRNTTRTVTPADAQVVKQRLVLAIRSHEPLVYGSDWEYEPLTVAGSDAQFVETMKLTATQVAAIYGIPPEMIGGETGNSLTYTNVEQHAINFVQFTLLPWLSRLEAAFSALLPPGQYVKFNVDALIRPDISTRYQSYRVAREIGLMSIDEIRALEDMAPLPGGRGQDYTPLAVLAKGANEPPAGRGRHRLELLSGGERDGDPDIDDGPGDGAGHSGGASVSTLNNGTTG